MISTGNTTDTASGGIWQDSRNNPVLPAQCGLSVAIIADLSNSVTATDLVNLKGAATTLVGSLTGTPSTVSLFTFATNAPAAGAANVNQPGLMPVSTPAGAATVDGLINGWALPGGADGGTNWDQAFQAVASASQHYDVVVMITDGNPTYYGNPVQGPGNRTRFREVENGIFSANAVKASGSRIVAMGVGAGVSGSPDNLRAISGPTLDSDYYQATDYGAAGAALRALALGSCAGSLTIVKQVVPPGTPVNSIAGAQPAGGWTFGASTTTTGVTINPASGVTADGTGAVNFALTFTGTTTAAVNVSETQQAGFSLHTINGDNAVCTRIDTGAGVPITNVGDGFTVNAASDFPVSCVVYNLAPVPPATLLVSKQWVVDGVTFPEGQQPAELTTSLLIDGSSADWSTVQTGFSAGDSAAITENAAVAETSLCTIDSELLTTANGITTSAALPFTATLQPGANTYEITNVVTCPAHLTLYKDVLNGPAAATDWTLNAAAPDGALPGPSGVSGVEATVTPSATYALSESLGDPRYTQVADPNAIPVPGSTVSWFCNQIDPATGEIIAGFSDGLNGGVTIPPGFDVQCQARNESAQLTLVKTVQNTHGGSAAPGDWTLTADPGDNDFGLTSQSVTGSSTGEVVWLRPGQPYTLSESGPDGYDLSALDCTIGTDPVLRALPGDTITLQQNQYGVCTFENVDRPAHLTLVKEVHNEHGGTATASDWTLSATGPSTISGTTGTDAVTNAPVVAGTYTLSESGPSGYSASAWTCTGGDISGTALTIAYEADVTCTITNTDQAAPPVPPSGMLPSTGSDVPWIPALIVTLGGLALVLLARRRRT
nr:VWA domain-containing protein [Planctomonas sp. JC2975]